MGIKMNNCENCNKSLNEATFLSESFNYDGGTMFFKCECGLDTYRSFLPTDLLSDEEKIRVIMQQEMGEEMANLAVLEMRKNKNFRKIQQITKTKGNSDSQSFQGVNIMGGEIKMIMYGDGLS